MGAFDEILEDIEIVIFCFSLVFALAIDTIPEIKLFFKELIIIIVAIVLFVIILGLMTLDDAWTYVVNFLSKMMGGEKSDYPN